MKLNNWEGRDETFLSNAFDGDAADIGEHLRYDWSQTIMEIGFGNGRLMDTISKNLNGGHYFGFDKTKSFVRRAREKNTDECVHFGLLDIENLEKLEESIKLVCPDKLILRYIIEHIPSWKDVLSCINTFKMSSILISIYTEPVEETFSNYDGKPNKGYLYTRTFFNDKDIDRLLTNYTLASLSTYKGVDHRLRIYETVK